MLNPAKSLLDDLLHAHRLARVNHVFGGGLTFHIQRVDANVDAGNALGLQRRDDNAENLGIGREGVRLAGDEYILDTAVDVAVHILVASKGGREASKGGKEGGRVREESGEELLSQPWVSEKAQRGQQYYGKTMGRPSNGGGVEGGEGREAMLANDIP